MLTPIMCALLGSGGTLYIVHQYKVDMFWGTSTCGQPHKLSGGRQQNIFSTLLLDTTRYTNPGDLSEAHINNLKLLTLKLH